MKLTAIALDFYGRERRQAGGAIVDDAEKRSNGNPATNGTRSHPPKSVLYAIQHVAICHISHNLFCIAVKGRQGQIIRFAEPFNCAPMNT